MSDFDPTDADAPDNAAGDESADAPADPAVAAAAEAVGASREELVKRALVALAESEEIDVPDEARVAEVESRLDAIDESVDERVADLRERFVELYRDLESTAPADHTHEETTERLDAVAAELDAVAARLDELETEATAGEAVDERLDAIDDRVAGAESTIADFDELPARIEALEGRVDDLDDVDEKLSRVASAVVRVRRRLDAAERDRGDRERLDALTAAANRAGVRKAKCTNCGDAVDLSLLTAPECPHCGRGFAELEPNTGFLGTSRLIAADQPALDGAVSGTASDAGTHGGDVSTRGTDGGRES
jgi:DNA repair exonuclease SbcCD ATPase subunit